MNMRNRLACRRPIINPNRETGSAYLLRHVRDDRLDQAK